MTNRERCVSLLDAFSEAQLANVAAMLHAVKDAISDAMDDNQPKSNVQTKRKPGIAQGKFVCPDDIDADNEIIANMFEGNV